MQLEALGLSEVQKEILEKKNIISAEALLKKVPLHYYDFKSTLPLSLKNPDTTNKLKNGEPFAITGMCTYFTIAQKNHMRMVKLRVREDVSQNTLFVAVMSADVLKAKLLDQDKNHPVNKTVLLPSDMEAGLPVATEEIKSSCCKQIQMLNAAPIVTAEALGNLKTGGFDGISNMPLSEL